MDSSHWEKIRGVYLLALPVCGPERDAILDRECGPDSGLRSEVESLLAHAERLGSFLEPPPACTLEVMQLTGLSQACRNGHAGRG